MPQNSNPKKLIDQIFIHQRNSVSETIFFICHGVNKDSRKYYDAVVIVSCIRRSFAYLHISVILNLDTPKIAPNFDNPPPK